MGKINSGNAMKAILYLFLTLVSMVWTGYGWADTSIYTDDVVTIAWPHSVLRSPSNGQTSLYFTTYQMISGGRLGGYPIYSMGGHTTDSAGSLLYDGHLFTEAGTPSAQGAMDSFALVVDDMGGWHPFKDGLPVRISPAFSSTEAPFGFGHFIFNGVKSSGPYRDRGWGTDNVGPTVEPEQSLCESGIMILFGIGLLCMAGVGKKLKRRTATPLSETCGGGRLTEAIIGTV